MNNNVLLQLLLKLREIFVSISIYLFLVFHKIFKSPAKSRSFLGSLILFLFWYSWYLFLFFLKIFKFVLLISLSWSCHRLSRDLLLRGNILFLLTIQSEFREFLLVTHMLGFGKLRSALKSDTILGHSLLFLSLLLSGLCLLSLMVNTSQSIPLEIVFSLCILGNFLLLLDLLDVLDLFNTHIYGSLSIILIRRFKLIICSGFSILLILLL